MPNDENYVRGRGAQINTPNRFRSTEYGQFIPEGLDEDLDQTEPTQYFEENPKKIINDVDSPDLGMVYSMNPYQGCEHGCIYCYARNTHEYWGFSAGMDFEKKIIVKRNAADVLEKQLKNPKWKVSPIMFSGNTDCYQPVERKLGITRKMLEVLLKYKHPVGMITKNNLILRDLDLLKKLSELNLVIVSISMTTLDESLRRKMEPRTTSSMKRMETVKLLSSAGIPVNVMIAPVIPAVNSMEIPAIMEKIARSGACSAAYTIVRLNGAVADLFRNWIRKNFPDRAEKVLHQIESLHGGRLNDSQFGRRMKGQGQVAESIGQLFNAARKKYLPDGQLPKLDEALFYTSKSSQLKLF